MNRDIIILNELQASTVQFIIEDIIRINKEDSKRECSVVGYKRDPINIYINSEGGECRPTRALINVILNSVTQVNTINIGVCSSSALILYLAGTERSVIGEVEFMAHNTSYSTSGDLTNMRRDLEHVERETERIEAFLCSRTKIKLEDIHKLNEERNNWYILEDEARELGIINK